MSPTVEHLMRELDTVRDLSTDAARHIGQQRIVIIEARGLVASALADAVRLDMHAPSSGLKNLINTLTEAGKRLASIGGSQ